MDCMQRILSTNVQVFWREGGSFWARCFYHLVVTCPPSEVWWPALYCPVDAEGPETPSFSMTHWSHWAESERTGLGPKRTDGVYEFTQHFCIVCPSPYVWYYRNLALCLLVCLLIGWMVWVARGLLWLFSMETFCDGVYEFIQHFCIVCPSPYVWYYDLSVCLLICLLIGWIVWVARWLVRLFSMETFC